MHAVRLGDSARAFAGLKPLARLPLLVGVELGLAANLAPRALAAVLPSFARFTMRWRSSSASAERKAIKPRPMGVVRSRCGLSSTFNKDPRLLIRSIWWTPSIMDLVLRSHSATTRMSPVPRSSIAFSSCGRFLTSLPEAFSRKISSQPSLRREAIWRSRFWVGVETRA